MSTKYVGETGQIQIATVATAGIKSWTLNVAADVVETTSFDDLGVKSYLGTGTGFSGSFEGYKTGAPLTVDGTVKDFFLQETSSAGQLWTGNLIITGLTVSASHDGLITYAYDFQGTGALTKATA